MTRALAKRIGLAAAAIALPFVLLSCGGRQSAVDSAGVQAERLEALWWLFLWICAAVYVIVMAVLIAAFIRNRRADAAAAPDLVPNARSENRASNLVKGAVLITLLTIFALMITSFRAGSSIAALSRDPKPLSIRITGNQWWWNVEYQDIIPSNNVQTANELHLPAGRVVKLEMQSSDVIHSFWAPNMHGKKDLVPNYPTTFYFRPDKPGTYWGQCAEFCGYQHAKMRFQVIVHTPEDFERWVQAQRQTPPEPTDPVIARGRQIFLTSTCTQCHAVQGTDANARVGPNLTHIAARQYIAAGSLPNTHENLKMWVTDPQSFKPGTRMPQNTYSEEDLNALLSYLESLK